MKTVLLLPAVLLSCATLRAGVFGTAFNVPGVDGRGQSVAVDGRTLYCGAGGTLYVFDVADPLSPRLLAKKDGFGGLRQMQVCDGLLAVSSRGAGAWLVDVSKPSEPKVLSHYDTVEQATGIEIAGPFMFVGQRTTGVEIVDISDRRHPEHVRTVRTQESQTCRYESGMLYSGDWHSGSVNAIDVTDVSKAGIVGRTEMHGLGDGFDLEGRYIYASTGHHRIRCSGSRAENFGKGHGIEIWDRSDAAHPKFVSRLDFPAFWRIGNDMWTCRVSDGWLFCADTYNGLFAVDVHDPANPVIVDRFCDRNPDDAEAPSRCISYVAVGDGAVYATSDGGGLWVIPCEKAKFRAQNRGRLPTRQKWRDPYATPSDSHFTAWKPPKRGQVHSVAAWKGYCYVGCSYAGAYVVDAKTLKTVAAIPCAYARDVAVRNGTLYVAQGDDGIGIYSLADPASPKEVRRIREIAPGVRRCEWLYVYGDRWAVCHARRNSGSWYFLDISKNPAVFAGRAPGMDWIRPFADDLVGGKWLGYAQTHRFFKWYDMSGDRPVLLDTEDKSLTGPIQQRPNYIRSQSCCTPFSSDRILVANSGTFFILEPAQNRNADGTPWPTFKYANAEKSSPEGLCAWDGASRVALAGNARRTVQMADFSDPQRPRLLWSENTLGYPENPVFHEGRLLVPCGYQGLLVHQTSASVFGKPERVRCVGAKGMAVAREGNRLFAGAGGRLHVLDVSDPLSPVPLGELDGFDNLRQIRARGNLAYVVSRETGLRIVDVSDPAHMRILSRYDTVEFATGVEVAGDVAFVSERIYGVEAVDVRDPRNPAHIAIRKTSESQSCRYRDGYLYSGEWGAGLLTVFDAHDMSDFRKLGEFPLGGFGDGVELDGKYIYCSTGHDALHRGIPGDAAKGAGRGLDIFDISDPASPKHVARADFPVFTPRDEDFWTPRVADGWAFCCDSHNGLFAVDVRDPAHPRVADRLCIPDARRPEWPSAAISSLEVGEGCLYFTCAPGGLYVVPVAQVRAPARPTGVPPVHAEHRDTYATDMRVFSVYRPAAAGQARAVVMHGDVAYAAFGDAGLHVVRIAEDGGFEKLGELPGGRRVTDCCFLGDRLLVAEGLDGFALYALEGAASFREIARRREPMPGGSVAFWCWAPDVDHVVLSGRYGPYGFFRADDFAQGRPLATLYGTCQWDRYAADLSMDGRYPILVPYDGVAWMDLSDGGARVAAPAAKSGTGIKVTQRNGVTRFGRGWLCTAGESYAVLEAPGVTPEWHRLGGGAQGGLPRANGTLVLMTTRSERRAEVWDFADERNPRMLRRHVLSGNPDAGAFFNGRAVIPAGHQGLLVEQIPHRAE